MEGKKPVFNLPQFNVTRHSCRNQTATSMSTTFTRLMQMLPGNTILDAFAFAAAYKIGLSIF